MLDVNNLPTLSIPFKPGMQSDTNILELPNKPLKGTYHTAYVPDIKNERITVNGVEDLRLMSDVAVWVDAQRAINWQLALKAKQADAVVPSFATKFVPSEYPSLHKVIPHSRFNHSPLSCSWLTNPILPWLSAKVYPINWFVSMPTPCEASYYKLHNELHKRQSVEQTNDYKLEQFKHFRLSIKRDDAATFVPSLETARYVVCINNHIVDEDESQLLPPYVFNNALSTAKYVRAGNVNDAMCLPPTSEVIAKWGQSDEQVELFKQNDTFTNDAATFDTYRIREAVLSGKCKRIWLVEGLKKAQHLMQVTGDYAVAVSGCYQFDAPSYLEYHKMANVKHNHAKLKLWQVQRQCLPTVQWFIDHGVDVTILTDVDYVSNWQVYDGVSRAYLTYKQHAKDKATIRLARTKSQCELDDVKKLLPYYSPNNWFGVETEVSRQYGRKKGDKFKWVASGIDDLSYESFDTAIEYVNTTKLEETTMTALNINEQSFFVYANTDDAYVTTTLAAQKKVGEDTHQLQDTLSRNNKTKLNLTEKNKRGKTTVKEVALAALALFDPNNVAVVMGGASLAELYLYNSTEGIYCKVSPDNEAVFFELLDTLSDCLVNDPTITSVNNFIGQLIGELPALAALTAAQHGFKRYSRNKLNQESVRVAFKGGHWIDNDGKLNPPSNSQFITQTLNVTIDECKQAYENMQASNWQPLKSLTKRLDLGQLAYSLGCTSEDAVRAITLLEIGLPVTGGSINGIEAIFWNSGATGSGKSAIENAIASILGDDAVANNVNVPHFASNRFARHDLVNKLVATAQDMSTMNEQTETALRNCFGMSTVEQKNQPTYQINLSPVFRMCSNYDKAYTADVAGSMTRRTIHKRYTQALLPDEWANYDTPVEMYKEMYMGLIYELFVVRQINRKDLERLFKRTVIASNVGVERPVTNTAELVVSRGCTYTGENTDVITMTELHSVAELLSPLFGIPHAKSALAMTDALKAMARTNNSEISKSQGLPPILLSKSEQHKDYLLHGFKLDKEWLINFGKQTKGNSVKMNCSEHLVLMMLSYKPKQCTEEQLAHVITERDMCIEARKQFDQLIAR